VQKVTAGLHHSGAIPAGGTGALPAQAQQAVKHIVGQYAATAAFADTFLVASAVAVVGVLLALTIRRLPNEALEAAPNAEGAAAQETNALEAAIG
jgi:hypothetical protein